MFVVINLYIYQLYLPIKSQGHNIQGQRIRCGQISFNLLQL